MTDDPIDTSKEHVEITSQNRHVTADRLARLEAAEEFTKFFHFMMQLGQVNTISLRSKKGRATRKWIGEKLRPWEDIVYPDEEQDNE